jgi:general stress protein YciG
MAAYLITRFFYSGRNLDDLRRRLPERIPGKSMKAEKCRKGLAIMSIEQRTTIAHLGGLAVSRNRRHMQEIGRIGGEHSHQNQKTRQTDGANRHKCMKGFAVMSSEQRTTIAHLGGLAVSRNRRHMRDIGRIGGEHSHGNKRNKELFLD